MKQDGEETRLVRYRYDDRGDMVETIDALDVSKHFVYTDGHLLVQLTNQGGMAFHWEYEGKGENARCVHTWGGRRRHGVLHPLRQRLHPYP